MEVGGGWWVDRRERFRQGDGGGLGSARLRLPNEGHGAGCDAIVDAEGRGGGQGGVVLLGEEPGVELAVVRRDVERAGRRII